MLVATNVFAQTESALDETFRSGNGKIYVVVAVLAVMLTVLFIYLIPG